MNPNTSETGQGEVIKHAILALAAARGADKTICPSEVARYVGGADGTVWRPLMTTIRVQAVMLAFENRIAIKKGGKRVDPTDFAGIYRIGIIKKVVT